ncbi:LrgB family protein [Trichococcus ilyis]|uniref:TIGR00659 family protein n=1 Tax=Trichococcus ilyis TaxID=640938 RepID=A0A143ZAX0_9LACT|nr:LrgB family protein [Trichococcus ilyis]CZR10223.1 Hypothetical protein TR210_2885 [Trichococcus ilyis]SEJ93687.1 TIGR00659 family protein [Trichococcus ilyis]
MIDLGAFGGITVCMACFFLGKKIQKRTKSVLANPIILAVCFILLGLSLIQVEYEAFIRSTQPLTALLTPATIALAVPLYKNLAKLRTDIIPILVGVSSGVFTNLLSILLVAKLLRFSYSEYITFLPKSITTAIGITIAEDFGGLVGIASPIIIFTGIYGSIISESVIRKCRLTHKVAKGVCIGTAAHAIGTAKAMELGETAGAASSFSLIASGILTVLLAPIFAGLF